MESVRLCQVPEQIMWKIFPFEIGMSFAFQGFCCQQFQGCTSVHLFTLASAGTGIADSFRFYILGRLPFRQMVNIAETMITGNFASGRWVGSLQC